MRGIPIVRNQKIFNVLSPKENCLVVAEFEKNFKSDFDKPHIVLISPSNSGNLGTIIRSSVGFKFRNIAIVEHATDVNDPKTVRASMGAIFHANVLMFASFEEYSSAYGNHELFAFLLNGKNRLEEVSGLKTRTPFSLIFVNETTGLPKEFEELDHTIVINHSNEIDSLNLSTAVAIAVYEFTRNDL